ncbi:hypothetical protein FOXYSP1_15307 [Fusarium oxysporum f. sp. phaseoli]
MRICCPLEFFGILSSSFPSNSFPAILIFRNVTLTTLAGFGRMMQTGTAQMK